jgi:hypothetical protein
MKLRPHALTVNLAPHLTAISQLTINAVCDSAPRCPAATSSIVVNGQSRALEGHGTPRPELITVATACLWRSCSRMTIPPSDSALHTPPWISSHVSSDKWTRGVAIELTGALSLAALTDGCHALAHSVNKGLPP